MCQKKEPEKIGDRVISDLKAKRPLRALSRFESFSDHPISRLAMRSHDLSLQGFLVGRNTTSLTNACGLEVTSIATAWATSSGISILSGLLPSCGENSVCVDPGHTIATRMLFPRSSSATE